MSPEFLIAIARLLVRSAGQLVRIIRWLARNVVALLAHPAFQGLVALLGLVAVVISAGH